MKTAVIHIRDCPKGWEKDPTCIYIGRGKGSTLGNPFSHMPNTLARFKVNSRDEAIRAYKAYAKERMGSDPRFTAALLQCKGKKLVCFCAPLGGVTHRDKPYVCHGQVIMELLQELAPDTEGEG